MTDFEDFVAHEHDTIVSAAGAIGTKRPEVIAEVAQRAAESAIALPIDAIEQLVASIVQRRANNERRAITTRIDWVEAALTGESILGRDDPALDNVVSVGGGLLKTWRNLNSEDWLALMAGKAEHAAASSAVSERFAKVCALVVPALARVGHDAVFGDLAS